MENIVKECVGCGKVREENCAVYFSPLAKWESGKKCPMATHLVKEEKKVERFINPLKQSKRDAAGK
jgi:hypothetical protein